MKENIDQHKEQDPEKRIVHVCRIKDAEAGLKQIRQRCQDICRRKMHLQTEITENQKRDPGTAEERSGADEKISGPLIQTLCIVAVLHNAQGTRCLPHFGAEQNYFCHLVPEEKTGEIVAELVDGRSDKTEQKKESRAEGPLDIAAGPLSHDTVQTPKQNDHHNEGERQDEDLQKCYAHYSAGPSSQASTSSFFGFEKRTPECSFRSGNCDRI